MFIVLMLKVMSGRRINVMCRIKSFFTILQLIFYIVNKWKKYCNYEIFKNHRAATNVAKPGVFSIQNSYYKFFNSNFLLFNSRNAYRYIKQNNCSKFLVVIWNIWIKFQQMWQHWLPQVTIFIILPNTVPKE